LCGLVCPDSADACDCGYSFAFAHTVGRIQLSAAARRNMVVGALVCFTGLSITALTLAAAPVTGISVVAWGAIVFGAGQFIRGWMQARRQRRLERQREKLSIPGASGVPDQPRE
jgi:hypothetical protein